MENSLFFFFNIDINSIRRVRIFENLHEFNIENLLELKFRRSNKIIFVKRVRIYIEIVTLTKIIVDFIKIYFDIKKSKLFCQ